VLEKAWKWGVVIPLTVLAVAGWVGDVVTATWQFWYLIWPSYAVILVAFWRGLSPRALGAREARRTAANAAKLAEYNAAESAAARAEHRRPQLIRSMFETAGLPLTGDTLIGQPRRVTIGSILWAVYGFFSRVLWSLVATFACMIGTWAAISIGIWARGWWFIWAPAAAAIAGLIWYVYRPERVVSKAGDIIVR
jgi:hypothetical protein